MYSLFFLEWLGLPKLDQDIIFVLNYCAIEILAIMVDNAILCREQEAKTLVFANTEHPADALQLRHYKEALRRSPGYTKNRDFLFGYY